MGQIDPRFSGNIFHKNYPQIIASDRALAKIIGARMAWQDDDVPAGTVVARRASDGYYVPYDDAVTGGPNVAVGVLLDDVVFPASATGSGPSGAGTEITRVCIGGASLYYDKLVGIDAAGLVDLHGREVVDAAGTNLLVF
jgi:hypothetical protein